MKQKRLHRRFCFCEGDKCRCSRAFRCAKKMEGKLKGRCLVKKNLGGERGGWDWIENAKMGNLKNRDIEVWKEEKERDSGFCGELWRRMRAKRKHRKSHHRENIEKEKTRGRPGRKNNGGIGKQLSIFPVVFTESGWHGTSYNSFFPNTIRSLNYFDRENLKF